VKKYSLTYSSGGKSVLKHSQRLQYVLDSVCLQYTSLPAEIFSRPLELRKKIFGLLDTNSRLIGYYWFGPSEQIQV
jgi:hypothetical protein